MLKCFSKYSGLYVIQCTIQQYSNKGRVQVPAKTQISGRRDQFRVKHSNVFACSTGQSPAGRFVGLCKPISLSLEIGRFKTNYANGDSIMRE
jgi:hypothetical protein